MDTVETLLTDFKKFFSSHRYIDFKNLGILNGSAGTILFDFYYSKYIDISYNLDYAYNAIHYNISKIKAGYKLSTYSDGICGFGWLLNHLYKYNFIEDCNDLLSQIDEYISRCFFNDITNKNFDLLHGASGYIFYLLERIDTGLSINDEEYKIILDKFIQNSIHQIKNITNSLSPIYTGLAHGISGTLKLLTLIFIKLPSYAWILPIINDYIDLLLKYENQAAGISKFPTFINNFNSKTDKLSWCNGDLGIGITLLNVSINLNYSSLEKKATNILIYSSKRLTYEESKLDHCSICHGYLGAYIIFLKSYKLTQKEDFLKASNYWLNKSVLSLENSYPNNPNLLNGLAGMGLALIDAYTNHDNKWSECLLI